MKDCYHNEEYSMVLRMIISEKWIHINSYDVCFDYNVKSVIILKQKIIVQLEIGDLYAVDMEGNIIWRIQNKERVCPEYKFISPYVMINYIDGELIVNDFNGFRFVFSPDDGTFVKRIQSLRPW